MDYELAIKRWLKYELNKAGRGSKVALAEYLGITPTMVTRILNIEKGEYRSISVDEFEKMKLFFQSTPFEENTVSVVSPPPTATFPSVPRYDIQLSAGAGSVNYEDAEILDHIPFTDELLTRKLNRSNTDGLICCDVHGDSMAPTLNDGDMVILDVQQVRDRKPAGIYAVTYGKESFVKRVEKVSFGYTLFSDNPAYETIRIRGDEVSRLHFVGKVIWSGGVMR